MKLPSKKIAHIIFWLAMIYLGLTFASPKLLVAEAKQSDKINICHRTSSQSNPFIFLTIARKAGLNGHQNHPGDIIDVASPEACSEPQAPPATSGSEPTEPVVTLEPSIPAPPSPSPSPTPQYGSTNICHLTGDPDLPYEFVQVSDDATYVLHANHTGDIFDVQTAEDCPTKLRKFSSEHQFKFAPLKLN